MDRIIQENLKTFAKGFMNQQSKLAELEEENRNLKEDIKKLKRRIDTMQEFIDYEESIVEEALKLMDVEDNDGARHLLKDNYAVGDDSQYELMEEYDKENKSDF